MKPALPTGFDIALKLLQQFDDSFVVDDVSNHFVQIIHSKTHDEVQIVGNTAGLIHIARQILEVANRQVEGSHHHFDANGIADECDIPVVVTLRQAEWD